MSNSTLFAGDIDLVTITLHSGQSAIDIKALIQSIEIFESVFEPFTTAKILIEDTTDLFGNMNLVGEELITMTATTPTITDKSKQLIFAWHLHSITDRLQGNGRSALYTLHCISIEATINNNRKISKGFSGKISEIATTLLKDTDFGLGSKKNTFVEDTSNSTQYVSNYWTPVKNLYFLSARALSTTNQSPSYVFFENRDGFNFLSLERLYQNASIQKFIKDNSASTDPAIAYNRIINFEVPIMFDYFENGRDGMYASTLHTYDITLKRFSQKEFITNLSNNITLNKSKAIKQITASPTLHHINDIKSFRAFTNIDDNTNTEYIQQRKSILGFSKYHKLIVEVAGRSDYTVGYCVDVVIPKNTSINSTDNSRDVLLSGKYIIAEINHTINGASYTCTMSLIKDSVDD